VLVGTVLPITRVGVGPNGGRSCESAPRLYRTVKYDELFARQGLSLSRLHALVLVAEAGSIAAAAPGDRNRQSLLSRQLNELEGFFPVALKKVDGRSIRLTPAGRELAGLARRQLDELANFYQRCCGLSANVSLAAGDGFLQWIVLPHLPRLRTATDRVVWHLHNARNKAILHGLIEESLDFGVICSDLVDGQLKSQTLGHSYGYALFVPRVLCPDESTLSLGHALSALPIAMQDDDALLHDRLTKLAGAERWKPNVQLSCDSLGHVVQAVAGGAYAGVLPEYMARSPMLDESIAIPVSGNFPALRRTLALAWNPQRLNNRPNLAKVRTVLFHHLEQACGWTPSSSDGCASSVI